MNKFGTFFFSFSIFGIIAVLAIVGLVLFVGDNTLIVGRVSVGVVCDSPSIPILIRPGETLDLLPEFINASYTCEQNAGPDEYGYETWCCTPPLEPTDETSFFGTLVGTES